MPSLLERSGRRELAWRWRGGAIHAAWFGLVVTSGSAALRLPLSNSLRVLSAVALAAVEVLAVRWLASKSRTQRLTESPVAGLRIRGARLRCSDFDVHLHAFVLAPWCACVSLVGSVRFC